MKSPLDAAPNASCSICLGSKLTICWLSSLSLVFYARWRSPDLSGARVPPGKAHHGPHACTQIEVRAFEKVQKAVKDGVARIESWAALTMH